MVVTYLGGLVLASSDEVGAVGSPLQVDNGLVEFVDGDVVQEIAGLAVVLADTTILVSSNDVLAHVAPSRNRGLGFVADNGQSLLVALLGLDVGVDIDDDNVTQVAHALFRDTEKPGAILVELDTLDGGGELPDLEALAALDVPEADGVIGRTRGDHGRGRVDIDGPDGTNVAVVGSETLAIVRKPGANLLILGDREDDIAIEVVAVDGEGQLVYESM